MIYLTQRLDHVHPITASVTLPIDVRVKSRARVALNDGREAGLMLPRGLPPRSCSRRHAAPVRAGGDVRHAAV